MAGKKAAANVKKVAVEKVAPIEEKHSGTVFVGPVIFKSVAMRAAAVKENLGKSQSLSDFLSDAGWNSKLY